PIKCKNCTYFNLKNEQKYELKSAIFALYLLSVFHSLSVVNTPSVAVPATRLSLAAVRPLMKAGKPASSGVSSLPSSAVFTFAVTDATPFRS
ncbi:TPA: hypothetical protein ACITFI_004589, partial [Salmonella enterica subsp. enterica serovar Typhimurium]